MIKHANLNSHYRQVKYDEIKSSVNLENVVGDFFRANFASKIQRTFRQAHPHLLKSEDETLKDYYQKAQLGIHNLPVLLEPKPSKETEAFLIDLGQKVKKQNFHQINFRQNDFTRHLFLALRKNIINQNQLLTIKLLFEAIPTFNGGQYPQGDLAKIFHRFNLDTNGNGPYNPSQIAYISNDKKDKLQQEINNGDLHYYTINLARAQEAFVLDQLVEENADCYWVKQVIAVYLRKHFKNDPKVENEINLMMENDTKIRNKKEIISLIGRSHDNLQNFLEISMGKEQTTLFLSVILNTSADVPSIGISPENDANNTKSPTLCFIIPSIDTLNVIEQCFFKDSAVLPFAVAGNITPRMIRAMTTIPALKSENDYSATDQIIESLYPVAGRLKTSCRPVEISHPDLPKTKKPHNYNCNDFLLTWHDIYHVWRCSENDKEPILRLINILDERGGIGKNHSGMSKGLWNLVDGDFGYTRLTKMQTSQTRKQYHAFFSMSFILESAGFDYKKSSDLNFLLLQDIIIHEKLWTNFLYGISPNKINTFITSEYRNFLFRNLNSYQFSNIEYLLNDIIKSTTLERVNKLEKDIKSYYGKSIGIDLYKIIFFLTERKKAEIILSENPKASISEIIIKSILVIEHKSQNQLFSHLKDAYPSIFYFSANNGIYFTIEARKMLTMLSIPFHNKVRENKPDLLLHQLKSLARTLKENVIDMNFLDNFRRTSSTENKNSFFYCSNESVRIGKDTFYSPENGNEVYYDCAIENTFLC